MCVNNLPKVVSLPESATVEAAWVKKNLPPQAFPAAIYTKRLTIFKFYTPFVYAYIYAKLQNFIQLSLTSIKLCGPVFKKLVLEIQYGGPPTRYRYPAHTISTYLKPIHTAITPGTTKLSCLCRVRFGSVNWIPDNSGLSPTESLKSKQVNSNCPIHTATPDTTETGLFCCVWRVGGVNWSLVGVVSTLCWCDVDMQERLAKMNEAVKQARSETQVDRVRAQISVGPGLAKQGPDLQNILQNILRQSYDYLTIMPKLRSTYDGRLIYKTFYNEWKAFHR